MDWVAAAISDLQGYRSMRSSIANMQENISILQAQYESCRISGAQKTKVEGGKGPAVQEDILINNIFMRQRLKLNIVAQKRLLKLIDRALDCLDGRQKRCLELFYIDRTEDYMDRLCQELCCERPTVYRLKDKALKQFTKSMYGMTDY